MKSVFAAGVSILLLATPAFASDPDTDGSFAGKHLLVFQDQEGTVSPQDVIAGKLDDRFSPSNKDIPNFGSTRATIYALLEIKQSAPVWIELSHPILDEVDGFLIRKKDRFVLQSWQTGDLRPFASRAVSHRNFLFPAGGIPDDCLLLLRVKSESSLLLPVKIWPQEAFYRHDTWEILFLGCFYGAMIVMIIYNLSIAFALKSLSSGLYVFYMVFLLITQAALDGIFYQVFPRLTTLNNMGATLWGSLSLLSAILFSGQYLEIRGKSRKAELAILLMATITFCAAIGSVLFGYRAMVRVQFFLGGLFPLILLGMGIWRLRQGYRPAVYFIFGFGAILTSVSIFALTRSGLISFGNFFVYHIMQFGFGFESVILSMGLAARFKHIQKEKQDALDTTIRQQRVMNQAIARFVPENFLRILGKPNIPDVALGDYVEKELTIVFLDIRSFTTISEALTPKQSFEYINGFLKIAGPVVSRNAGFIDKYTGDGILALFESPFNALQASLQLQLAADKCHDSAMATFGQPLRIGIGIHYGKVMLGTIGEPMRMDGTVISDAVNIASRIENLTKQFNIGIIATQAVLEAIESRDTQKFWMANHLGSVALKGKTNELEIYGISPDRELESPWPRASGA